MTPSSRRWPIRLRSTSTDWATSGLGLERHGPCLGQWQAFLTVLVDVADLELLGGRGRSTTLRKIEVSAPRCRALPCRPSLARHAVPNSATISANKLGIRQVRWNGQRFAKPGPDSLACVCPDLVGGIRGAPSVRR